MTRYLLSVHTGGESTAAPVSEEEMRRGFEKIAGLEEEMEAAGALVLSARLDAPDAASVVRANNGRILTTDGPFLESKEMLGGFYIIEAPDRETAVSWASKTSAAINTPIEVRPFFAWRGPGG
jgi:hypothetical protein